MGTDWKIDRKSGQLVRFMGYWAVNLKKKEQERRNGKETGRKRKEGENIKKKHARVQQPLGRRREKTKRHREIREDANRRFNRQKGEMRDKVNQIVPRLKERTS